MPADIYNFRLLMDDFIKLMELYSIRKLNKGRYTIDVQILILPVFTDSVKFLWLGDKSLHYVYMPMVYGIPSYHVYLLLACQINHAADLTFGWLFLKNYFHP